MILTCLLYVCVDIFFETVDYFYGISTIPVLRSTSTVPYFRSDFAKKKFCHIRHIIGQKPFHTIFLNPIYSMEQNQEP